MGTYLFFGFATFGFGLIVGSFLNVCIYRLPREESLIYPPSHCPKCYQPIRAEDNIPVLSWLLLRGKCRFCGQRISIIYPAVELFTGALFAFYYWRFISPHAQTVTAFPVGRQLLHMGALYLVHMAFISALVVVTFVDFKHLIIPDEISIGGTVLAVAASLVFPEMHNIGILQN
ncbi:MAG: prepilin peptidase, partial [Planctomycetes bacterium]|nr:prepilin peptidase [Planctomycetota bacterium]